MVRHTRLLGADMITSETPGKGSVPPDSYAYIGDGGELCICQRARVLLTKSMHLGVRY